MAPPNRRLLVSTVLRPLGEHLVMLAQPTTDDLCIDLGCTGGVMPALLGRTGHRCIAVAEDPDHLAETAEELSVLHLPRVDLLRARSDALPLRDGCVQVVTSLFALPQQPDAAAAAATLRELLRILDPLHGRLLCALWTAGDDGTPIVGRRLDTAPLLAAAPNRARIAVIRDVARFDGVDHYRAAVSPAQVSGDVERWTARDGTLRIPTETVTLAVSPARW